MKNEVIIIAEAGVNHNGSFEIAKKLIKAAADAGADYVKFQTFKADKLVTSTAKKAAYQLENINDGDDSQFSMLKNLEMPESWHYELSRFAQQEGIQFLSTGFDEASIDFLDRLGVPFFKIPSGEITNKPFLRHIASKGKPIIISTGMATYKDVRNSVEVLLEKGVPLHNITILHCNTEYPTPMKDVNLLAMITLKMELGVEVGYSDHTLGIEVPIAAVALGARVIEKHFTIDKTLTGPDHLASLDPYELKAMVSGIRNIELAISGSGIKEPSESEMKNISVIRKSLYFKHPLKANVILHESDLIALRPGNGISPMEIDEIVGKVLVYDVSAFEQVNYNHIR